MATAMVRRWLATGLLQSQQIAAATRTETSAARVRQDLAIACDTDIDALVSRAEVVLLAIKPQQLERCAARNSLPVALDVGMP